jgi:hypothetical protein
MPETVGQSWQKAFPPEAAQARDARAWVVTHTDHSDARGIAGELIVAVLASRPGRLQMTVSTAGPRVRITAAGDRPLPAHALHGPGRQIIGALASVHGITPDDCGLWAELPRETTR